MKAHTNAQAIQRLDWMMITGNRWRDYGEPLNETLLMFPKERLELWEVYREKCPSLEWFQVRNWNTWFTEIRDFRSYCSSPKSLLNEPDWTSKTFPCWSRMQTWSQLTNGAWQRNQYPNHNGRKDRQLLCAYCARQWFCGCLRHCLICIIPSNQVLKQNVRQIN